MTDTTPALDQTGTISAKVAAIKAIRTFTGLGLLEAKLVSDALAARYVPEKAPPPDAHHAQSAHNVTVAKHSQCLHCGGSLPRRDWGAVFCGPDCFGLHRRSRHLANTTYLVDVEIMEAEQRLLALRERRASLFAKD